MIQAAHIFTFKSNSTPPSQVLSSFIKPTCIQFSTVCYGLPTWSLIAKEMTAPTARLYYRVLKIQSNLPMWSYHCIALARTNALTFHNVINSHAIALYFQVLNSTLSTFTALCPTHNVRQIPLTRSVLLTPVPAFRNSYDQVFFSHLYQNLEWHRLSHQCITIYYNLQKAYRLYLSNVYVCSHWSLNVLFMRRV